MNTQFLEQIVRGEAPGLMPLNVDQYHRMIETGILPEGSNVELLDGLLVLKDRRDAEGDIMNVGPRHSSFVTALFKFLDQLVENRGFHVRCQQPITLPPGNEPEPDVSVAIGDWQRYFDRHPTASELAVVIEIADSSLQQDRDMKQRIYASAGIPTYWIVNVVEQQIECFTQPTQDSSRYQDRQVLQRGDSISLALQPGETVSFALAELFPNAT